MRHFGQGLRAGPGASRSAWLGAIAFVAFVALTVLGVLGPTTALAATGTCSGLSYAGCNLQGMDFAGQDLAGADFSGANLQGANFGGADLAGADLSGANMQGDTLTGANLSGANLSNVNLQNAAAQNVDLDNANLSGAHLQQGTFTGCTDAGATLGNVNTAQAIGFCSAATSNVVPVVDCVSADPGGGFVAYFGFTNPGPAVDIPVGSANSVTPASRSGGQPTDFPSGTQSNAFSVAVPGSGTAQWSVDGSSATAASNGTPCQGSTLPADPDGASLLFAVGGGGLVGWIAVRRAARVRGPARAGPGR